MEWKIIGTTDGNDEIDVYDAYAFGFHMHIIK